MPGSKTTPDIRFEGFNDAWEQRKWEDTVDISTNMVDPKSKKYDELPHIGPGNIESFTGRLYNNVNTVKNDNLISGKFYFHKGDIIYGKINPQLGKYILAPFEGLASADAYVLNAKNELDQKYLFVLLQTYHFFRYSVSVSMRSGMPKINRDELNEYSFEAPSLLEQRRIGKYFLRIDHLITLHQREHDKIVNIKKAMLEKMFPKDGADRPEIRFAGFSGAWERRKFDSVFDPIPNNTLSRAHLNYVDGKIKNVHYGDILIKYGAVTDCGKDDIPFVTGAEISNYQSQFLQDGDVLIADAAEDITVGKATEIAGVSNIPIVSGLHTIACRPKTKMQPNYLGYYMNSPSYHRQLLPLMQGIKVLSISRSNIAKTTVLYPTSEKEQLQIGAVFAQLDRLIALHQRELAKLQNIKKSLLEKMFV